MFGQAQAITACFACRSAINTLWGMFATATFAGGAFGICSSARFTRRAALTLGLAFGSFAVAHPGALAGDLAAASPVSPAVARRIFASSPTAIAASARSLAVTGIVHVLIDGCGLAIIWGARGAGRRAARLISAAAAPICAFGSRADGAVANLVRSGRKQPQRFRVGSFRLPPGAIAMAAVIFTVDDLAAANRANLRLWAGGRRSIGVWLIVLAVIVTAVIAADGWDRTGVAVFLAIVAAFAATVSYRSGTLRLARRQYRETAALRTPVHYAWDESRFRARGASGVTDMPWSDLHAWHRYTEGYLLFPSSLISYVVPLRAVGDDADEEVLQRALANGDVPEWRAFRRPR